MRSANYNKTKIVVYLLPKDINSNEIKSNLEDQKIITDTISIVERINGKRNIKTAFISLPIKKQRNNILNKQKIKIGICYFFKKNINQNGLFNATNVKRLDILREYANLLLKFADIVEMNT